MIRELYSDFITVLVSGLGCRGIDAFRLHPGDGQVLWHNKLKGQQAAAGAAAS